MRTLDPRPTDAVIAAVIAETLESTSLLGRRLGDGGPAESLEPSPTQQDIAGSLVGAYCEGTGVYLEGAEPGIPAEWRSLRAHSFLRGEKGMVYRCDEFLPDLTRFEGPIADPGQYEGILSSAFTALATGLAKALGKPKVKRKNRVELEWGGHVSSPTWGGLYLTLDSTELKIGGGDSAPWRCLSLKIELMGAPRS